MNRIFIDGAQGTTGLRLEERLAAREDLEVFQLPEERRKSPAARKEAMAAADITFLCLPDDAARESVVLAEGTNTRIIDASTAHRTSADWVYGFPELNPKQREKIKNAMRVAVPGCHASGFTALINPLRQTGVLTHKQLLSCFSLTGYSGGGKGMMDEYENHHRSSDYNAPRQYALGQVHKHLPEMCHVCELENAPVFAPIVADFAYGMAVSVPLHLANLGVNLEDLREIFVRYYEDEKAIRVLDANSAAPTGFISCNNLVGMDCLEIVVAGNDQRAILTARLDNLGKGASGAAVQCMNLMLGAEEFAGLILD